MEGSRPGESEVEPKMEEQWRTKELNLGQLLSAIETIEDEQLKQLITEVVIVEAGHMPEVRDAIEAEYGKNVDVISNLHEIVRKEGLSILGRFGNSMTIGRDVMISAERTPFEGKSEESKKFIGNWHKKVETFIQNI
jgi:hypothetical protein